MIEKRGYLIAEYAVDEKKLANYIEGQISAGKSLSELKKESYSVGIPKVTINKAIAIVFKDEIKTIQTDPQDNLKPNIEQEGYVDIIFNIFAIICIAVAVFFFLIIIS